MRSSSWNDEGPAQKAPRRSWVKWVVLSAFVVFGLPALIGGVFGGMALSHRMKVWPAVRLVHTRLQTDAGVKELFAKNPALAGTYAGEQDFLETARAWRAKVGELPALEPDEGPAYSLSLDPEGAGVRVQGKGGAWMQVDMHGGALAGSEEGEGVVRLFFAEDEKGLRTAEATAYERKDEQERAGFRQLFQQCEEDAPALALYRKEAGLRASYPSETAFLEHLKPLRPAIAAMLANPRTGEGSFRHERRESPLGRTVAINLTETDGRQLTATWRNGQLTSLEGDPPKLLR